jgi:MFS family permease
VDGGLKERLSESLSAFRAVFANPNLRRVELAWTGSETGKWMYVVAVAVYAYGAGGAAAVGLVALIRVIPAAVIAPFAAVLADRFRRERVMLFADISRAAILAGALVVVVFDGPAAVVYALAGVVTVLSTTFRPAQSALLPTISRTPEELTAANVTMSTIAAVGIFAGPAVGGLLLAATRIEVVFAATAGTFLLSALQVARIRAEPPPARRPAPGEEKRLAREVFAGFSTIIGDRGLRLLVTLYCAQTIVAGALGVLIVVASIRLLHLGDAGVGYLNSAFGVGGLIGAGLTVALVARQRLASDFALGTLLWGIPLVLIGIFPSKATALVLIAFVGIGDTLVEVAAPTLLQRAVPDEVLGRVFGAVESMIIGAMGIGAIAAPALVDGIGTRGALIVSGGLLPVLGVLFWRRLAAIDRDFALPARQLELLRTTSIFAPLPEAQLERLAAELEPVAVAVGDTVVRESEPGDRFYLVDGGELAVSVGGSAVRTLGPGDHFGEIALLRDVPRTATVTARTEAKLYALERDEFIAAVTGHAPSADAADAVIAQRLATARTGLAVE